MWHFDIYHNIYSEDMHREIRVVETTDSCTNETDHLLSAPRRRRGERHTYILRESWYAPNSKGDTGDFDYYEFHDYQSASFFLAELAIKLNSCSQQVLMRAADVFATRITKEFKDTKKQHEVEAKEKQRPAAKLEQQRDMRHVYVFDMENDTVKIGISNSVGRRRNDISNSSGMDIPRWCYSKALPKNRAFGIEAELHRHFNENRTRGEFFKIPYADACDKLSEYTKVFYDGTSSGD